MGDKQLKLGVIFGGSGPEHEASLSTAKAVIDHLDSDRYELTQFAIEKSGAWLTGPQAWSFLYTKAEPRLLPIEVRGLSVAEPVDGFSELGLYPQPDCFNDVEVIFPLVHGKGGEDGALQTLSALYGKPCVGCRAEAAANTFNKWMAKQIAHRNGIPSARAILVRAGCDESGINELVSSAFGELKVIVKPAANGSSFGVHAVQGWPETIAAIADARRYSDDVIVEEFLDAEEIFVAIMGNGPNLIVSPPVTHGPGPGKISSYFDKYIDVTTPVKYPTGFGARIETAAKDIAAKTYVSLGCSGFARVDLFFCPTKGILYFNEVNSIPALAVSDTFPTAMAAANMGFSDMLDRMIGLSKEDFLARVG